MAKKPNQGIDQHEFNAITQSAQLTQDDFQRIADSLFTARLFKDAGKLKASLDIQFATQDICIIDWLNFTFHQDTFYWCNTTHDVLYYADEHMKYMFGFGITEQRKNGAYGYDNSYTLGDAYGMLCIGGERQRDTVLISLNGTGCTHLKPSSFELINLFLRESKNPKITRIDLAHDDFTGENFNIESIVAAYESGGFTNGTRTPSCSQLGNWLKPDGSGRTFTVGKRTNGLYFRGYEKGCQLNSESSPNWFRSEVEIKSTDRIVPFDILLTPHFYFAGSFPVFSELSKTTTRIETFQHEINADVDHRIAWAKRQTGNLIHLLEERGYTRDHIINSIKRDELPATFKQKFIPKNKSNQEISDFLENEFFNVANLPTTKD